MILPIQTEPKVFKRRNLYFQKKLEKMFPLTSTKFGRNCSEEREQRICQKEGPGKYQVNLLKIISYSFNGWGCIRGIFGLRAIISPNCQ